MDKFKITSPNLNSIMDDNTELDVHSQNQIIKCFAGILLNHDLYINGLINKLLIDMDEDDYQQYLKFLQTL